MSRCSKVGIDIGVNMKDKLIQPFRILSDNKELIFELARRDITDRYKGQPMGVLWAFIHPLVMIAIYVFLFAIVFQAKISSAVEMPQSYSAYILSGMVPWLCFQTAIVAGAASIITNGSFIRQVIFPVEVFPNKVIGSAIIIELIYLGLVLTYNTLSSGRLFWSYLLLPVALLFQILFLIGINYLTSSISAYWRDVKDIVQVFCAIGVYLAPIVYLPDGIPQIFRPFIYINPFSYYIWIFQDVLYFGKITHPYAWVVCVALSVMTFYLGNAVFQKLKISFGSVV